MATTVLTILQSGIYTPSTSVWTAAGVLGLVTWGGPDNEYWHQFDQTAIYEQKGGPLVTAFTISLSGGWTESGTLTMYTVARPVRTNFDSFNTPPRPVREPFHTQTLNHAGVPETLTIPLSTSTGQATAFDHLLTARTGRVALGLTFSGTGGVSVVASPTVTHQQGFTGLVGHFEAEGRADECPTCGGRSTRDTWVRDGWTGLMVCPRCYDDRRTRSVGG